MPETNPVIAANLGANVAAFTCRIEGRPTAVVNTATKHNAELRGRAVVALLGAGLDAGLVLGALYGVRR
ncbi:hypothetical protein [Streptomyces sp. NPDC101115]|uniref:hypothetical protein n=1 Tax=Streptomyces sp. NPDC101115 TaxID=3366106 RepID=UPI003817C278